MRERAALLVWALAACSRTPPVADGTSSSSPPSLSAITQVDAGTGTGMGAGAGAGADASGGGDAGDGWDAGETRPIGMKRVPAGTFVMGADKGGEEDEHPAHAVTLAAFDLDETEVTNEAYGACVTAKVCARPDPRSASANRAGDDKAFRRPRQPVVGVSWFDAKTYCEWRGKRLPREAEWERAVRGDDGRRHPWGNEPPTPARAVFGRPLGGGATDDVGTHPEGRGPYGHDDLAGNVWEWMADEYDPIAYTRPSRDRGEPGTCKQILEAQDELRKAGKQGFTGSNPIPNICERVLRGGAFNYDGPGLRASNRVHHPATFRLVMAGFRCAKNVD